MWGKVFVVLSERKPNIARGLVVLDWEAVGLGSGLQDLSQYLISHMAPATRRTCEDRLVREYYRELMAGGVHAEDYPFTQCWADYVAGGSERWVWLMALLSGMCPDALNQYFQDQVAAFLHDHVITPTSIGMPRV
jgi:hypothetical protein